MLEQPVSVLATADLQYPNSGYSHLDWVNAFRAATVRYPAAVQGTTDNFQVLSAFHRWWGGGNNMEKAGDRRYRDQTEAAKADSYDGASSLA